jgi:hypothetical protein|nr:MAG TPA: hypothetical protein [Caudoviricetes sp.]
MKGMFNFGLLGIRRVFGGVMPPKPSIDKWVKEHMVFWYDMSKPVDVYVPGVTYANQFVNEGGKITYDKAINKCTITHTPTSKNRNFWQTPCAPSSTIDSYRIRVTGLPKGFYIQSGYYSNKITADGEYDIDSYTNKTTSTMYPGFYLAGDNVADVDCNIVVEEIPTRQSVPTNEILKVNPYLQDFSGNNRPLKLNNFLFAAMSGVGGYELNWTDQSIWSRPLGSRFNGTIEPHKLTVTSVLNSATIIETIVPSYAKKFKVKVSGVIDEIVAYIYKDTKGVQQRFDIREDGEYELPSNNVVEANFNMGWRIFTASYPHTCNITIEQIPVYPNALVTDGVDDYGVVENLQQGVKVLFMTAIPLGLYKTWYAQDSFSIYGQPGITAYNFRNTGGVTYLDGILNEAEVSNNLLNKKKTVTIVNPTDGGNNSIIFFNSYGSSYMSMAFYNSIGFDSVPTKETDGFTEQDLITWVTDNMINGTPQSGVFPYVFPLKVN